MERPTGELHSDTHTRVRITVGDEAYEFELPAIIGDESGQCPAEVAEYLAKRIATTPGEYQIVNVQPEAPQPTPDTQPPITNLAPLVAEETPTTEPAPAEIATAPREDDTEDQSDGETAKASRRPTSRSSRRSK